MKNYAVVIGVDGDGRPGKLPKLNAARDYARRIVAWLERESYEISSFIDTDTRKVTLAPIVEAVTRIVDAANAEKLLVYFAGHGFLVGDAEFWMLSDAPRNPNEAINLTASKLLARQSGIPNITFVSDACRSLPDSFQPSQIQGGAIFPAATSASSVDTEIDTFYAARPTQAALEIKAGEAAKAYTAVYTEAFLEAFEKTPTELVRPVEVDGASLSVVPSRPLKKFLRKRVPRLIAETRKAIRQEPDAYLECGDQFFLARASVTVPPSAAVLAAGKASDAAESIGSSAISAVLPTLEAARVGRGGLLAGFNASKARAVRAAQPGLPAGALKLGRLKPSKPAQDLVRDVEKRLRLDKLPDEQFETGTGIVVRGARVREVFCYGMRAALDAPGGSGSANPARIRLHPEEKGNGTLLVRLEDGSGFVIACLRNYVGTVHMKRGRIEDIAYLPRHLGPYDRKRVALLHATAAAAAKRGDFRVRPREASAFASRIRILKKPDPTLGLHAAYAYADAGLGEMAAEVYEIMHEQDGVGLYDVALMAGALKRRKPSQFKSLDIHPFCPMLMRGWAMLGIKNGAVSDSVSEAAKYLQPGLWTKFGAAGMDILFSAAPKGRKP